MTELLTAAEMRAIEQAAIASGRVTGLELMERAGQGVVEAIEREWPAFRDTPGSAAVLCGPGNNGGDGFVVARLLAERGWTVAAYVWGTPQSRPADAAANFDRCAAAGLVRSWDDLMASGWTADLVIDALFGIGLTRPIEDEELWELFWEIEDSIEVRALKGRDRPVFVAVDVPSGLCADTGAVLGGLPWHGLRAPPVDLTVTFHALKHGHVSGPDHPVCGRVVVAGIGL